MHRTEFNSTQGTRQSLGQSSWGSMRTVTRAQEGKGFGSLLPLLPGPPPHHTRPPTPRLRSHLESFTHAGAHTLTPVCVHTNTNVHMHTQVIACAYAYFHMCTCVHSHARSHVCTPIHTLHTHRNTHAHEPPCAHHKRAFSRNHQTPKNITVTMVTVEWRPCSRPSKTLANAPVQGHTASSGWTASEPTSIQLQTPCPRPWRARPPYRQAVTESHLGSFLQRQDGEGINKPAFRHPQSPVTPSCGHTLPDPSCFMQLCATQLAPPTCTDPRAHTLHIHTCMRVHTRRVTNLPHFLRLMGFPGHRLSGLNPGRSQEKQDESVSLHTGTHTDAPWVPHPHPQVLSHSQIWVCCRQEALRLQMRTTGPLVLCLQCFQAARTSPTPFVHSALLLTSLASRIERCGIDCGHGAHTFQESRTLHPRFTQSETKRQLEPPRSYLVLEGWPSAHHTLTGTHAHAHSCP